MQRQKIRPSLADLQHLDDEFDETDSGSDNDIPEYAPSATPFRGPPPSVASVSSSIRTAQKVETSPALTSEAQSDSVTKGRKVVRIAPSNTMQYREIESRSGRLSQSGTSRQKVMPQEDIVGPESFRFTLNDSDWSREAGGEETDGPPVTSPLIGTIKERTGVNAESASRSVEGKTLSRFALKRRSEKSAGSGSGVTEGQTDSHASKEDEEWLDEDGVPMSAFRKERLRKQGMPPPSSRTKGDVQRSPRMASTTEDSSMSDLLSGISRENEAKVSSMSVESVEESLVELQEMFGTEVLERLKQRAQGTRESRDAEKKQWSDRRPDKSVQDEALQGPLQREEGEATPELIRSKFFPHESEKLPLSLQWTQSVADEDEGRSTSPTFRFDFDGQLITDGRLSDRETRLTGLHHHGSEQSRAGYSLDELLHLARSTLPSQRVLALQTLERILLRYPTIALDADQSATETVQVSTLLVHKSVRGMTGVICSWYIEDRQGSVRLAALRCLRSCLLSSLSGPSPVRGVVVDQKEQQAAVKDAAKPEYNVNSFHFSMALLPCLCNVLGRSSTTSNEMDAALDVLNFLCNRSVEVCDATVRRIGCIEAVVEAGISKRSWPAIKTEERPSAQSLHLLLALISSQRANAVALVERRCIEPLLRFLALPPWKISTDGAASEQWLYFDLTMQIYAALATYGIYSDVVQKGYSLLSPILEWIRTFDMQDGRRQDARLRALSSCLSCFKAWTVCATDPHQTSGRHDIGWSQVADWWECAVECGKRLALSNSETAQLAAAEAVSLLDSWLTCASRNKHIIEERVTDEVGRGVEPLMLLIQQLCASLSTWSDKVTNCIATRGVQPIWKCGLQELHQLSNTCAALSKVMRFIFSRPELVAVCASMKSTILDASRSLQDLAFWTAFDQEDARAAGVQGLRRPVVYFCYLALQQNSGDNDAGAEAIIDILQLLRFLRAGDEAVALQVVMQILPARVKEIAASDLSALQPFLAELLRTASDSQTAPLHVTPDSLTSTQTLFLGVSRGIEEGEDVDPLSGAELWKSKASGLPLRADWPLAALDDLLHSGNCASLNRKDALSVEWDANERQIVLASLRLATAVCSLAGQHGSRASKLLLPSSAELHLAIIKVFMLEEEQSQDPKVSGLITGRDLFRDEEIVKLLDGLFEMAKQFDVAPEGIKDDMEQAARRQFGTSLPFYQLYTSFLGLYDSISFGMELFGRAVLLPLASEYAMDYKRLLWIDYAPCLATLTSSCAQSPYAHLKRFLIADAEDQGVLQAMAGAVKGGVVSKDRNGLLYSIAMQQAAGS